MSREPAGRPRARRQELRQAKRDGRIAAYEEMARWALSMSARNRRNFYLWLEVARRATAGAYRASGIKP